MNRSIAVLTLAHLFWMSLTPNPIFWNTGYAQETTGNTAPLKPEEWTKVEGSEAYSPFFGGGSPAGITAKTPVAQPKAPEALGITPPVTAFGCKREMLYKDQFLPVDSFHCQDGENLRNLLKPVPDAVALLDRYQANQQAVNTGAYIGSAGLILFIGTALLAKAFSNRKPGKLEPNQAGPGAWHQLASYGRWAGAGLLAGSTAVFLFDHFRGNPTSTWTLATVGGAGLLLLIGPSLIVRNLEENDPGVKPPPDIDPDFWSRLEGVGNLVGLGVAAGSTVFTLSVLRRNESNLQKAVDRYNQESPENRIELQFQAPLWF